MRLKDRVILVTGSTTGVGEAIARAAAAEGARVIVHGTKREAGQAVAADINESTGREAAHFAMADLSEPHSISTLVADAAAFGGGRLDALVNNAAMITRSDLESTTAEIFDRTMAVNARAPMLLIQAALPHFRNGGGGRVLNIGSINAHCGERNQLAYSMSKAALVTLTRSLADAHGAEGLRVNCLNLGWVLTPNEYQLKIREGLPPDWPEKISRHNAPAGRIFKPEEIGAAAVFFLSDDAALLNGGVLDYEQFPVIGRNPEKTGDTT